MKRIRKQDEQREITRIFKSRVEVSVFAKREMIRGFRAIASAHPLRKANWYWCDECGGRLEDADTRESYVRCPHCGALLLKLQPTAKSTYSLRNGERDSIVYPKTSREDRYVKEILTYKGQWQVIKEYFATKYGRIGEKPRYEIRLVYSHWMNPESKHSYVLARWTNMMPYYARSPFSLNSAFHFARGRYGLPPWYYDWNEFKVSRGVLPYYLQHGYNVNSNHEEFELRAYTADGTILETLKKTGQGEAAVLFVENERYRRTMITQWRGIVIALRHGYDIGSVGWRMWLDYLAELRTLHLDWHSPHYLCPKEFHTAHAETSRRATRLLRERAERMKETRRRRAIEANVLERERIANGIRYFEKRIEKFLPLTIEGAGLIIRPLATVQEFADEGAAMHHCVYSNGYYMRPECLILSARTAKGERVETIEVSLDRFDIVQSRGVCNQPTDYHDTIINLVTEAMPEIKALAFSGKPNVRLTA